MLADMKSSVSLFKYTTSTKLKSSVLPCQKAPTVPGKDRSIYIYFKYLTTNCECVILEDESKVRRKL